MNLTEEPTEKPLWSVLISSFDDNCDIWPIFFHFLFKHWPDVPTPVYLVTNFRKYDDPRVVSLCVGADVSWGDTMTKSLEKIPSKHVWMLLEDFFLTHPIRTERIDSLVRDWDRMGGKYLETGRQSDIGPLIPGTDFRRIPAENPQAGINSAMYEVQFLKELAQPGWSLWRGNTQLGKLNRESHPDLYYLRKGVEPMIQFVEAVKGRFWKPVAMDYLKATAVQPDLAWRPFPPQGQGMIPKLIRSIHKRRIAWRKKRDERRCAAGEVPPLVRPMDV